MKVSILAILLLAALEAKCSMYLPEICRSFYLQSFYREEYRSFYLQQVEYVTTIVYVPEIVSRTPVVLHLENSRRFPHSPCPLCLVQGSGIYSSKGCIIVDVKGVFSSLIAGVQ